jgi:hypothetical protein
MDLSEGCVCTGSVLSILRVVELSYYFVHPRSQHCNPETHFMRLISLITIVMFTEPYYFHTYLVGDIWKT